MDDLRTTKITGKSGLRQNVDSSNGLILDILEGITEITMSGRKILSFSLEIEHAPLDEDEIPQKITGTVYRDDESGTELLVPDEVEKKIAEFIEHEDSEGDFDE